MRMRMFAVACFAAGMAVLGLPSTAHATNDFEVQVECRLPIGVWSPDTVDDTNLTKIKYNKPWTAQTPGQGQYLGTQHITNYGGATASFVLPTAPYVFAFGYTKMRNAGIADVYFNNVLIKTIDMYAPANEYHCLVVLYGGVPAGTFMVKAVNRRNPASQGTYVNVDYIHYET